MDELPVRIVLLAETGSGKSSAGNVILGENKFGVSSDPNSVTLDCQTEEGKNNNMKISVTDTPGIFYTESSDEDLKYSIISCLTECAPGPHTFIIVLKVGRYIRQEASVRKILDWFGEEALKHTVVLFTHGDELEENQTIKQYVKRNKDLKELVYKCGDRVHVIDSKYWRGQWPKDRSNSFQIKELLTTIKTMTISENNGRYYTNESLQLIAEAIEEEVKKIKKEMKEKGENAEEPKIRRRAGKQVRDRMSHNKCIGFAVGALAGTLLGGCGSAAIIGALLKRAGATAVAGAIGGFIGHFIAPLGLNPKKETANKKQQ